MAISIGDAVVNIFGDDAKLKQTLDATAANFKKVGVGVTAVGGIITGMIGASLSFMAEQEKVEAQLDAVLKSTGNAAGLTADEIKKMASELQNASTMGDEAIIAGQNILLTFTNIGKDAFPLATQTAVDMSTALGTDLKGQMIQLGKALNDPIKGVSALADVGVSFTDQQKEQIKTLIEANDTFGAQKVILDELAKEFGGSALAASQTFSGQLTQMKNSLGDVAEEIGFAVVPILVPLVEKLRDAVNAVIAWKEANPQLFETIVKVTAVIGGIMVVLGPILIAFGTLIGSLTTIAGVVGTVITAVGGMSTVFATVGGVIATIGAPIAIAIAAIVAIGVAVKSIYETVSENWDLIASITRETFESVASFFSSIWDGIKAGFSAGVDFIKGRVDAWIGYFSNLLKMTTEIWGGIVNAVLHPLDTIKGAMDQATGFFRNLFGASIWPDYFENLRGSTETNFGGMRTAVEENLDASAASMDKFTDKLEETQRRTASSMSLVFNENEKTVENLENSINLLLDMAKKASSPEIAKYYQDQVTLLREKVKEIKAALAEEEESLDEAYGNSWFPELLKKGVDAARRFVPELAVPFKDATNDLAKNLSDMKGAVEKGIGSVTKRTSAEASKAGGASLRDLFLGLKDTISNNEENLAALDAEEKALDDLERKAARFRRLPHLGKLTDEERSTLASAGDTRQRIANQRAEFERMIRDAKTRLTEISADPGGDLAPALNGFDAVKEKGKAAFDAVKDSVGTVGAALNQAAGVAERTALRTGESFLSTAELISNSLLSVQLRAADLESRLFYTNDLSATIGVLRNELATRQNVAVSNVSNSFSISGSNGDLSIANEVRRQLRDAELRNLLGRSKQ